MIIFTNRKNWQRELPLLDVISYCLLEIAPDKIEEYLMKGDSSSFNWLSPPLSLQLLGLTTM
jgi:hypothetical protein